MNEGTPSGSEYNKPMAVVLKGPTAELYLYFFLANRVSQIQELTTGCEWRHVASTSNPG
jgi:hypothetical protein